MFGWSINGNWRTTKQAKQYNEELFDTDSRTPLVVFIKC